MSKKIKSYSEAELIKLFSLTRLVGQEIDKYMLDWTNVDDIELTSTEKELFETIWKDAVQHIQAWQEEDLKMQFIAFVLKLGHFHNTSHYHLYFERIIEATIENHFLKTKIDFMLAKGILDLPEQPYFHFQEWKPHKKPSGDSMGQLLEAMLIAQELNNNRFPIYGCEIIGKQWNFIILYHKTYSISKSYDCTDKQDLLQIIAILRKFKKILETRLLD